MESFNSNDIVYSAPGTCCLGTVYDTPQTLHDSHGSNSNFGHY